MIENDTEGATGPEASPGQIVPPPGSPGGSAGQSAGLRSNSGGLDFSVTVREGHAILAAADQPCFGWLLVDSLELEVPPELERAADPERSGEEAKRSGASRTRQATTTRSGEEAKRSGASRTRQATTTRSARAYQRRRTRVRAAALHIDGKGLASYRDAHLQALAPMQVSDVAVALANGYLSVAARVREGKSTADTSFRLYLGPCPSGVRAIVGEPRVYGHLSTPAPLLAHRIIAALLGFDSTASPRAEGQADSRSAGDGTRSAPLRAAPRVIGLGQFEIEPLEALLWHTLPRSGWRLPSVSDVELTGVRVTRDTIEAAYGPRHAARRALKGDSASAAEMDALVAASRQFRAADDALVAGDIDGALTAYRGELAAGGRDQWLLIDRILTVSVTRPALFVEAGELARKTLERRPELAIAHATLAVIAAAQGHVRGAASHYQRLVELASDDEAAIRAALAGARFLRTTQPEVATHLYEQVLARDHGHAEASAALAERYTAEERWPDLVKLLRAGLVEPTDPREASRGHLRLAEVLRTRMGDTAAARVELDRACQLAPENLQAFEAKVELELDTGREQEALDTLDDIARILSRSGDAQTQVGVLVRTAELCERLGQWAMADGRYHRALELAPDNPAALAGAASLSARRGDHETAAELWQKLSASDNQPPRETARYRLELGRSLAALGDRQRASEVLHQTAYQNTGDIAAEAHAVLANLSHQAGDLPRAAEELEAAVDALTRAAESFFAHAFEPDSPDSDPSDESEPDEDQNAPWLSGAQVDGAPSSPGKRYLDRAAELSLRRAGLLTEMGNDAEARNDFQRAHTLARDAAPRRARQAARSLLEVERKLGDKRAQRRWIDALLATQPEPHERVGLLLHRAELRARDPDDADGALADLDDVLAHDAGGDSRAMALSLQARLLASLGDRLGRATSLTERASLVHSVQERAEAEADAAEAWLEAEDADTALATARRAVEYLEQAEAGGAEVAPAIRHKVLALLGDTAWRHREWNDIVRAYEPLFAELGEVDSELGAGARARSGYRLGTALDSLGQRERAAAILQQVLSTDDLPGELRTSVWRSLADVYERTQSGILAAQTYEALATDKEAKAGTDSRAEALYRASELYRSEGDHAADAERCLLSVLNMVTDHMPALDALEKLYRNRRDDEAVASILARKINLTSRQPNRQKALLARLAALQGDRLGQVEKARESYRQALAIDPDFRPALRFVAPDELAAGNLDKAADAYERLARDATSDGDNTQAEADLLSERIDAAAAMADVALRAGLTSELGRRLEARARSALAGLLAIAPGHRKLVAKQRALATSSGAPGQEAHASEGNRDFDDRPATDPSIPKAERIIKLREQARVAQARGDSFAAARFLDRVLVLLPDDPELLRERADLAAELGDYGDWAFRLEQLLAATPGGTSFRQRARRSELYLELADLYNDHLSDPVRARQAMRDAAEAHGTGSRRNAILRLLATDATAASLDSEAAEAYEAIEPASRTSADVYNLALCYERLGRLQAALVVLTEARESGQLSDEGERFAARLAREFNAKRSWASELESTATGPRAESRLHEALELYETILGDEDGAARVRARLKELGAVPAQPKPDRSSRASRGTQPLGSNISQTGSRKAAGRARRTSGPVTRSHRAEGRSARRKLSGTSLGMGMPGLSPRDISAGGKPADAPALGSAAAGQKTTRKTTEKLPTVARTAPRPAASDRTSSSPARTARRPSPDADLRRAAELEALGQSDAAISHYEAAANAAPDDPRALQALLRIFDARGDVESSTDVLGRLIHATNDAGERAQLWYRRAKLHRDVLHSESETYRCLKEANACDPEDRDIAYALRSIAMARGEWPLAAQLIEREIAAAIGQREAGALNLELALVYDEKLLDPDKARLHYEVALELDPEIPAAPGPLARLYEMAGRYADAARMQEMAAKYVPAGGIRSRLLSRAAACAERADDDKEAQRLYQRAIVAAVDDSAARSLAQSALTRLSTRGSSAETLEWRLQSTTDEGEQLELLRQLLDQAQKRQDSSSAARYARALLSLDGADPAAYVVLKGQAEKAGDFQTLAAILHTRANALSDPGERAAAYYDLGRIHAEHLDNERAAQAAYEEALRADWQHPAALEALADMAYQNKEWERAHELHARLSPDNCSLSADSIAYRRGVIAEAMGRQRDAIRAYSEAVELVPSNKRAIEAKVRTALRIGDLSTAIEASQARLELIPPDDVQAMSQARLELADIHERAGDRAEAIEYNELVLAEDPRSEPALRALVKLYTGTGRFKDAARTLRALIGLTGALARRAELLYRLGEICRLHLSDPARAADAYLKGIDLNPRHVPTLRRLIDYYFREDEPDELLEMVTALAEQAALLSDRTSVDSLIRAMITAASRGKLELTRQILSWLGPGRVETHLVSILHQATRRPPRNTSIDALVAAVRAICQELPSLSPEAIAGRLEASGGGDFQLKVVAALRAPI